MKLNDRVKVKGTKIAGNVTEIKPNVVKFTDNEGATHEVNPNQLRVIAQLEYSSDKAKN